MKHILPTLIVAFGIAASFSTKAEALEFIFKFSGQGYPTTPSSVTGIVSGLLDNTNHQKSNLRFDIISATNTPSWGFLTYPPAGGWPIFQTDYQATVFGSGIDVQAGSIVNSDIALFVHLPLCTLWNCRTQYLLNLGPAFFGGYRLYAGNSVWIETNYSEASDPTKIFIPKNPGLLTSPVPGPVPIFGAMAAYKFARRIKRRKNKLFRK
jgi:hypothetical protein